MKTCVKCRSDLPDGAAHCVFCGEKQPTPAVNPPKKTVMGHAGMSDPPPAAPERGRPPGPHQGPGRGPHAPPSQRPQDKPTVNVPGGVLPAGGPPPAAQPSGAVRAGAPGEPSGPMARTAHVPPDSARALAGSPPAGPGAPEQPGYQGGFGGAPGPSGPHGGGYASPAGHDPHGHHPMVQPQGAAPASNHHVVRAGAGDVAPPGAHPSDTGAARPAYHAASYRLSAPHEPWEQTLKTILLVVGVILAAFFVAPWSVAGGKPVFAWSVLVEGSLRAKLPAILLASSAILSIVFALVPLAMTARALAAAVVGLAGLYTLPIIGLVDAIDKGGLGVQQAILVISPILATSTLIPGLLLRCHYRPALLPRVLVTLGVLFALAPFLYPAGGALPLVGLFQGVFADVGNMVNLVQAIFVVITVAALLVWLPAPSTAGAGILAWLLIFQPVALTSARVLGTGELSWTMLERGLAELVYIPLAGMAWLVLASYGLAGLFGKRLES